MDHFNATVRNGHLVATRRGLQVSKQKFKGLSFVNSYAGDSRPSRERTHDKTASASGPVRKQFKFVERGSEQATWSAGAKLAPNTPSTGTTRLQPRKRSPKTQKQLSGPKKQLPSALTSETASNHSSVSSVSSDSSSVAHSQTASPAPESLNFVEHQQPFLTDVDDSAQLNMDDGIILQSLPSWAGHSLLDHMTGKTRRQFEHFYSLAPRRAFPYEDILAYNPIRGSDFYNMVIGDHAAIHCILMSGFLYEAVRRREPDSGGFAFHIAKICALLNKRMDENNAADAATFVCVASLASMGYYVGRLDHFNLHMRGLGKLVESRGGWHGLPEAILTAAHNTDIKGAVVLASAPYFTPSPSLTPLSDFPVLARYTTLSIVACLLSPLGISQLVIDNIASAASFSAAVSMARSSGGALTFDPHSFTDEMVNILFNLLVKPGVLRDETSEDGLSTPFEHATNGQNYFYNHRLRKDALVTMSPASRNVAAGPLEPALRIGVLLFLRELLPDDPKNVGGHAVLLALLAECLKGLLASARGHEEAKAVARRMGRANRRQGSQVVEPMAHDDGFSLAGLDLSLLDPRLLELATAEHETIQERSTLRPDPRGRSGNSLRHRIRNASVAAKLRPAVLWLCVLGNLISALADEAECRQADHERYERRVYRECLIEVGGIATESDVDALVAMSVPGRGESGENPLALFRLFDVRSFAPPGWNERSALNELLALR